MTKQTMDWTAKELAAAAAVNESRIRQLLLTKKIKGTKRANVWFISDSEARRWLESREKTSIKGETPE